jgi:uncharacterized membrane protein
MLPGAGAQLAQRRNHARGFPMTPDFRQVMTLTGLVLDGAGVCIVAVGSFLAVARFLLRRGLDFGHAYRLLREDVGRAILLGLEFLIAGDIIRSVVVDPTVLNIVTLGLIVLIRTFLSMTLQLEVEGRWPWQQRIEGADTGLPRAPVYGRSSEGAGTFGQGRSAGEAGK